MKQNALKRVIQNVDYDIASITEAMDSPEATALLYKSIFGSDSQESQIQQIKCLLENIRMVTRDCE